MNTKELDKADGLRVQTDPRREERRRAILDAAESLFLEQGFVRVSLAAIIRRSGGSLATVYELFGNKHGLLRAVIDRDKYEGLEEMHAIIAQMESTAEIARFVAHRIHESIMKPRRVAMLRIVIAESLNDPEFARDFYREVHLQRIADLATVFCDWNAEGRARFDDPEAAAELFLALVTGDVQLNAMIGDVARREGESFEDRAAWRLEIFIRHFGLT